MLDHLEGAGSVVLRRSGFGARAFHRTLPDYAPTPLIAAPRVADALGVRRVLIKNEQERLGIPSFKILGASWAVQRALVERLGLDPATGFRELATAARSAPETVLTCATDGNHGRAVARMARLLGLGAHIYVPVRLSRGRIEAIRQEGAVVEPVGGTYDDAVAHAAVQADEHGERILVSDTATTEGARSARWVIEGYATIFAEIDERLSEMGEDPTRAVDLISVPAGVGAFAAAVAIHYRTRGCVVMTVEPVDAACVQASLRAGRAVGVPGPHRSAMEGLNCGEPSLVALPYLLERIDVAATVTDDQAATAMRDLAALGIESGASGAASLAGVQALVTGASGATADRMPDANATVLVLNTEGAADPHHYAAIAGQLSTGA